MVRDEVLNAKAEELRTQLTKWAREANILTLGEVLVFSLHVEQGLIVRRNEHDKAPEKLVPNAQMCAHRHFIAPARLTDVEIEELLTQVSEYSRAALFALLKLNQNAPLRIWSKGESVYQLNMDSVNTKLRSHPVEGKYYWLVKQSIGEVPAHEYWCQLWEVQKK